MAAVMMSALVDDWVVFMALDVGWIARLGAALAGRVVATSQRFLTNGRESTRHKQDCCSGIVLRRKSCHRSDE